MKGHVPQPNVISRVMEVDHARLRLVSPQDIDGLDLELLWKRQVRFVGPTTKLASEILDDSRELGRPLLHPRAGSPQHLRRWRLAFRAEHQLRARVAQSDLLLPSEVAVECERAEHRVDKWLLRWFLLAEQLTKPAKHIGCVLVARSFVFDVAVKRQVARRRGQASQMARSSSASARVAYRSERFGAHIRPMTSAAPVGSPMKFGLSDWLNAATRSSASIALPFPARTASASCLG